MVTKLSKIPLAHQPGRVWEYSMAVDVQGRIIEVVSGMPLDQFINERIAKPLGMTATDFYVHEGDLGRLAEAQPAGADHRMPPDVTKKPNWVSGGGGLVARAGDYLGFAERTAEGHNPLPGSVGNFYWTGAWGTTFWVDPKEQLIAIQMIQAPSGIGSPFRHAFRDLVYAALTGGEVSR